MVARAGRKSRLEQLEKAPCAVERMMVVPHRRVVQFARALAKRAGGHSHENLLESYSCRGRVAQLGEHLLCKQGVAGSSPVTSTIFPADNPFSLHCVDFSSAASLTWHRRNFPLGNFFGRASAFRHEMRRWFL